MGSIKGYGSRGAAADAEGVEPKLRFGCFALRAKRGCAVSVLCCVFCYSIVNERVAAVLP